MCRLAGEFDCRVGGGIRDHARADRLLRAGARKIIVGTQATPEFLSRYPRLRVIAAVDARAGRVVTQGWTAATDDGPVARAKRLEPWCSEFLYTLVEREGLMGGIDLDAIAEMVQATTNRVVAAGGITTVDEVRALDQMGASCQLGMAIYTGFMDLGDAFCALLDWPKNEGLLPVVVQDDCGQVIMHAWADKAAVKASLDTGQGTFFSRSRQASWRKGATSGHIQKVLAVRMDCDRDTLLYRVEQSGQACHLPTQYACFGEQEFGLQRLQQVLRQRAEVADEGSYTRRLFADPVLLKAKIIEEAAELVEAEDDGDVIWETADVIYFALANLVARGIPLARVERELYGRHGRRREPDPGAGS
jgi:phosphoribosyl-ATP pyrophosphohydrolase